MMTYEEDDDDILELLKRVQQQEDYAAKVDTTTTTPVAQAVGTTLSTPVPGDILSGGTSLTSHPRSYVVSPSFQVQWVNQGGQPNATGPMYFLPNQVLATANGGYEYVPSAVPSGMRSPPSAGMSVTGYDYIVPPALQFGYMDHSAPRLLSPTVLQSPEPNVTSSTQTPATVATGFSLYQQQQRAPPPPPLPPPTAAALRNVRARLQLGEDSPLPQHQMYPQPLGTKIAPPPPAAMLRSPPPTAPMPVTADAAPPKSGMNAHKRQGGFKCPFCDEEEMMSEAVLRSHLRAKHSLTTAAPASPPPAVDHDLPTAPKSTVRAPPPVGVTGPAAPLPISETKVQRNSSNSSNVASVTPSNRSRHPIAAPGAIDSEDSVSFSAHHSAEGIPFPSSSSEGVPLTFSSDSHGSAIVVVKPTARSAPLPPSAVDDDEPAEPPTPPHVTTPDTKQPQEPIVRAAHHVDPSPHKVSAPPAAIDDDDTNTPTFIVETNAEKHQDNEEDKASSSVAVVSPAEDQAANAPQTDDMEKKMFFQSKVDQFGPMIQHLIRDRVKTGSNAVWTLTSLVEESKSTFQFMLQASPSVLPDTFGLTSEEAAALLLRLALACSPEAWTISNTGTVQLIQ